MYARSPGGWSDAPSDIPKGLCPHADPLLEPSLNAYRRVIEEGSSREANASRTNCMIATLWPGRACHWPEQNEAPAGVRCTTSESGSRQNGRAEAAYRGRSSTTERRPGRRQFSVAEPSARASPRRLQDEQGTLARCGSSAGYSWSLLANRAVCCSASGAAANPEEL